MAPINFRKGFGAAVAANQRVFAHDRTKTLGASEAGACLRRAFLSKFFPDLAEDVEEDDVEWGQMERGNVIENAFAVPMLRHMFTDKCLYMGADQKTLISGQLSATPDGILIDQPRDALAGIPLSQFSKVDRNGVPDLGADSNEIAIEIKSADPRTNLDNVKPVHKVQNIVQMGIYQAVTNYRPQWGIVLYIDPVNFQNVTPFAVKYDPPVLKTCRDRAARLFAADAKAADFAAEGKQTGECQYCPFQRVCVEKQMQAYSDAVVPFATLSAEHQAESKLLVENIVNLRGKIKALETSKKGVEENLKTLLTELGTARVGEEGWYGSFSKCAGKKSIDKGLLVNMLLDLANGISSAMAVIKRAPPTRESAEVLDKLQALTRELELDRLEKQGIPYFRLNAKFK